MFKFNKKSLKKFTVISASALMLLSVGGGAVASHANVHADAFSKFDATHPASWVPESTKRDEAEEAHNAYEDLSKNPQYAKGIEEDESSNPYFKGNTTYQLAVKHDIKPANKHVAKKHAKRSVRRHINRKSARKVAKAKRQIKQTKRQINRKNRAKKHIRKHAKKQSLQQQINGLKREMRSLQRQINRLERGYRK